MLICDVTPWLICCLYFAWLKKTCKLLNELSGVKKQKGQDHSVSLAVVLYISYVEEFTRTSFNQQQGKGICQILRCSPHALCGKLTPLIWITNCLTLWLRIVSRCHIVIKEHFKIMWYQILLTYFIIHSFCIRNRGSQVLWAQNKIKNTRNKHKMIILVELWPIRLQGFLVKRKYPQH